MREQRRRGCGRGRRASPARRRPPRRRRRSRRRCSRPRPARAPRARGRSAHVSPAGAAAGGRTRVTPRISRTVVSASTSASPCATARMPVASSSGGVSLSVMPLTPARSASSRYSSMSNVLRSRTRIGGPSSATIRRVASIPSMSGIRTSISTTSGCRRSASATAVTPSPASPTISTAGSISRPIRIPSRTSSKSSTISTRTLTTPPPSGARAAAARRPRSRRRRAGPSARRRRTPASARACP